MTWLVVGLIVCAVALAFMPKTYRWLRGKVMKAKDKVM